MDKLNLRKLKVLVAVAETQSATRAGEQLHLGQSAVSQTLKELQEDLGITLFERAGRGLVATQAGLRLASEGQRVLAALTRANTVATALQRGELDEVAVGVMTPFIHGEIARCIARFSAERSPLSLTLESHKKARLIDHVLHTVIWTLLWRLEVSMSRGSPLLRRLRLRVICITPLEHPLAGLDVIHDFDLKQHRQIILTEGSALRVALESVGVAMGNDQQAGVIKASTQRAIVTMVEAGAGVALVDPLVLSPKTGLRYWIMNL